MSNSSVIRTRLRRWWVPNAIYFVTAVTRDRVPYLESDQAVALLRETMRRAKELNPFAMRAFVFLPDHMHLLLYLPPTSDISRLLHCIERNYTLNYKRLFGITEALKLWQRGFWDHVIRDEADYERHMDYIHHNPVKHGYVASAHQYPHSSLAEYVRRGWYDPGETILAHDDIGGHEP